MKYQITYRRDHSDDKRTTVVEATDADDAIRAAHKFFLAWGYWDAVIVNIR